MITLEKIKTVLDLNKLNDEAQSHNAKIKYVMLEEPDKLIFSLTQSG